MPVAIGTVEGDQDLFIFQEDDETTAPKSPAARNMFESWTRASDALSYEQDPASSQTANGRTFTEITLELPIEQLPSAVPMPLTCIDQPTACDPFGEDFDEEFTVEAHDVRRWQERQRANHQLRQAQKAAKSVPPAAASHAAPQLTQSVVGAHFETLPNDAFVNAADAAAETIVQPQFTGSMASDFVSVTGSAATDDHLQREIEDLISQLNFSAFSVEMDSVEQISPEFTRQAAGAAHLSHSGGDGRSGEAASHPIRREEEPHSIRMESYDDDRDMLIIEEEVPASVRHTNVVASAPTMNSVSYPQLFQQLRG